MGRPMVRNLIGAGYDVLVWNRSPHAVEAVANAGAQVATDLDDLFDRTDLVLLMLAHAEAVDAVLDRNGPRFAARMAGHLVVPMGTVAPAYSAGLAADVARAGGRYVEAPVSGSRPVAEAGQLVVMLSGREADLDAVEPFVAPMGRAVVRCGPVPGALRTKLAVNLFLITMVTGLCEAWALATAAGLDLATFRRVLDEGPMASAVSRAKSEMLLEGRFPVQAGLRDVLYNAGLVSAAAADVGRDVPLLSESLRLFAEADRAGLGDLDMAAVVHALEGRANVGT